MKIPQIDNLELPTVAIVTQKRKTFKRTSGGTNVFIEACQSVSLWALRHLYSMSQWTIYIHTPKRDFLWLVRSLLKTPRHYYVWGDITPYFTSAPVSLINASRLTGTWSFYLYKFYPNPVRLNSKEHLKGHLLRFQITVVKGSPLFPVLRSPAIHLGVQWMNTKSILRKLMQRLGLNFHPELTNC